MHLLLDIIGTATLVLGTPLSVIFYLDRYVWSKGAVADWKNEVAEAIVEMKNGTTFNAERLLNTSQRGY